MADSPTKLPKGDVTDIAHTNRELIISHRKEIGKGFLVLAFLLKENRDNAYYKILGYDSFEEFLAEPDLAFRRSTVYNLIHQYELYIQELKCNEDFLAEIGSRRLQIISPVVKTDPSLWLDRAKELTKSDLILEVREAQGKGGEREIETTIDTSMPVSPALPVNVKEYLERLKEEPCIICGLRPVDLAHFPRTQKRGAKDWEVLPLCRKCHSEQHLVGVDTWLAENKQSIFEWLYKKVIAHESATT